MTREEKGPTKEVFVIIYSYYNPCRRKQPMMNNEPMNEILTELSKPFHPGRVTWRPGALTQKKDKALALAYGDLRAYQDRLDDVCGLDWSVSYTPWGDRIICHLTINGITRSSTGEPDSESERSEIAGTAAEAQAFKRACAMFGLGRYLYTLPTVWVDYDVEHKRFTDKARMRLNGIIANHYQRFLDGHVEENSALADSEEPTEEPVEEGGVEMTAQENGHASDSERSNGGPSNGAQSNGDAEPNEENPIRQKLNMLGEELYGNQWAQVRAHNVKRLTGQAGSPTGSLTTEQLQKLIGGLEKLKQQRQTA